MTVTNGIVSFTDATVGEVAYVYSGQAVTDMELGFVTELDYFDDDDEPVKLTRQMWLLVNEDEIILHRTNELCGMCDGEGTIDLAEGTQFSGHYNGDCPRCKGDGQDPLAGTVEVIR